MALHELRLPTIMLWPNADAGSEDVARGMRKYREHFEHEHVRFYKNFPVEIFVRLMLRCAVMVGNSSAMIREGSFLGVPAVNLGSRQQGRERGENVLEAAHERGEIMAAIKNQLAHGRYSSLPIYGDGTAGERIADILATTDQVRVQKQITY